MKKVIMWFKRLKSCLVDRRMVFAGQLRCFKRIKRRRGERSHPGISFRRSGKARKSELSFWELVTPSGIDHVVIWTDSVGAIGEVITEVSATDHLQQG
jgi:hypothetical protein